MSECHVVIQTVEKGGGKLCDNFCLFTLRTHLLFLFITYLLLLLHLTLGVRVSEIDYGSNFDYRSVVVVKESLTLFPTNTHTYTLIRKGHTILCRIRYQILSPCFPPQNVEISCYSSRFPARKPQPCVHMEIGGGRDRFVYHLPNFI